jgi:pimeloyl-ACP methyl ester carboxylesterase
MMRGGRRNPAATRNTHLLGGFLPNATVSVYPDAGHGFLFQYPDQFAAEVLQFPGSIA